MFNCSNCSESSPLESVSVKRYTQRYCDLSKYRKKLGVLIAQRLATRNARCVRCDIITVTASPISGSSSSFKWLPLHISIQFNPSDLKKDPISLSPTCRQHLPSRSASSRGSLRAQVKRVMSVIQYGKIEYGMGVNRRLAKCALSSNSMTRRRELRGTENYVATPREMFNACAALLRILLNSNRQMIDDQRWRI